jgi:transcriptional regulator with XRE-family HTH domain
MPGMVSPLGEFLRARRTATTLDQAGLPHGGRRRTPGLRREEVSVLAGLSTDYYIRLEQGRERRPSDQVLDALARAFQLDAEATEHLHELARPRIFKCTPADRVDRVSPHVLRLMDGWDQATALLVNRRLDVLARNRLSVALLAGLDHTDNLMRLTFLNPAAREFLLDWEQEAWFQLAYVRAAMGADLDDPALLELVEELSLASEDFRQMWARHDVGVKPYESGRFHHRDVGEMTLYVETFAIDRSAGQRLFVAQAEPGSPSERALAKLRALSTAGA